MIGINHVQPTEEIKLPLHDDNGGLSSKAREGGLMKMPLLRPGKTRFGQQHFQALWG